MLPPHPFASIHPPGTGPHLCLIFIRVLFTKVLHREELRIGQKPHCFAPSISSYRTKAKTGMRMYCKYFHFFCTDIESWNQLWIDPLVSLNKSPPFRRFSENEDSLRYEPVFYALDSFNKYLLCMCYISSPVPDIRVTTGICRDPTLSHSELEKSTLDKWNICEAGEGRHLPCMDPT